LLTQGGKGDPLAHPRLTLVGRLAPSDAPRDRARFLRRHPKAELYADFPDFHFWRMDIAAVHLNGGFARAADYPGRDILIAPAPELAAMEVALLAEINAWTRDERGALAASAGEDGALHWRAVGLDAEGLDLAAPQQTARLTFDSAVPSPENWSATIKKLSSSQNSVA
jgi:putative heme iron utilization protein